MQSQRHLFNIPADIAYFNGAYMSPQLKMVEAVGMEAVQRKGRPFDIGIEDFFTPVQDLKASFARLINTTEANRVAILPSVSYGIAQVAKNIQASAGSNIVLMEEQFPSNYYTWKRLADQENIELRMISGPKSFPRSKAWNESILASIDQHTAVVSMGHIHWADGTLFDLEMISQKAKSVGALLIIDGTQSVGALPFDVARIRPDALICGGYKWLMGPYSIGLGYFGPAFDDGVPIEENWINRANSEDFKNLVNYQSDYKPLANRYSVGEQSNFILVPMMQTAIEQLIAWQAEEIQLYCQQLLKQPLEHLEQMSVQIEPPNRRAHHLVGLRLPKHIDMELLKANLRANQVHVSYRGNAIRLSCHLYNDTGDVECLMNAFRG